MPVVVACTVCANKLKVSEQAAGKAVKCPTCGKPVRVPALAAAGAVASSGAAAAITSKSPAPKSSPPAAPPSTIVTCAGCQKQMRVRAELAGKAVKCPGCGKPVNVPAQQEAAGGKVPVENAPPAEPSKGAKAPASTEDWERFAVLKQPAFLLKQRRPGFVFKQWPPKKRYYLAPVESEESLAEGCEKRSWLWVFLRNLLPFRVEFRDANGSLLFTSRTYGFPLPSFQFFDPQGHLIIWFKAQGLQHRLKTEGFVAGTGYWVYDPNDQQLGLLKPMNVKVDVFEGWTHWALVNTAGEELVQLIDEVEDAAARKGGSSGWVTDPGGVIRFPQKRPADAYRKILGIAAALVLEIDGRALAPDKKTAKVTLGSKSFAAK